MTDGKTIKVLFLCTGNSCRSQMAEGWAKALKAEAIESYSAGVVAKGLDPRAVEVMAEAGIDISSALSKTLAEFTGQAFDYVVTVCDNARESCPVFPGRVAIVHCSFDDPPGLAASVRGQDEALDIYRRVRDEIRSFIEGLPGNL